MGLAACIIWLLLTASGFVKVSNDVYWMIWGMIVIAMSIDIHGQRLTNEEDEDENEDYR